MTEETLFAELIKDLDPFDRKVLFALDALRAKQDTLIIMTSRFELCSSLRLAYNPENLRRLDQSLERLAETPLWLPEEGSGFAIATKAIVRFSQEQGSEKMVISLEKLFTM